jgi:hypothetical protein
VAGSLFESGALASQPELDDVLVVDCAAAVSSLAAMLDYLFHVAAFGPDQSASHLELLVCLYLNVEPAGVLYVFLSSQFIVHLIVVGLLTYYLGCCLLGGHHHLICLWWENQITLGEFSQATLRTTSLLLATLLVCSRGSHQGTLLPEALRSLLLVVLRGHPAHHENSIVLR